MAEFLGELSKDINVRAHRINQNWGNRHHKTVLGQYHYFLNAYKYVYQNPLRAGLCRSVEEWPYSTLHGLLGFSHLGIPLEPDSILFNPDFDERELAWLNRLPGKENLATFQKALRKREFKLPKVKRHHPHELESQRF